MRNGYSLMEIQCLCIHFCDGFFTYIVCNALITGGVLLSICGFISKNRAVFLRYHDYEGTTCASYCAPLMLIMALRMRRSLLRKALTLVLNSGYDPTLHGVNGMYASLLIFCLALLGQSIRPSSLTAVCPISN